MRPLGYKSTRYEYKSNALLEKHDLGIRREIYISFCQEIENHMKAVANPR